MTTDNKQNKRHKHAQLFTQFHFSDVPLPGKIYGWKSEKETAHIIVLIYTMFVLLLIIFYIVPIVPIYSIYTIIVFKYHYINL